MPWWVHTAAGLVLLVGVGAAAWRLAGRLVGGAAVPRGLAAAGLAWLVVQVAGIAGGIVGGGTALVPALVLVAASGAVLARVPARASVAPDDAERAMLRAVGLGVATLAALGVARPAIGFDGLLYHLAIPAAWAGEGRIAGLPTVVTGLPVEAYPVGVEVALSVVVSVTGATVTSVLLGPLALGVATVAVWTTVRRLGGGVAAAWGAVASSVVALPFLAQGGAVGTDLPAAALMACGTALVVRTATGDGPRTDVPALLVGLCGLLLALGVKTTAACGGLLFLLLAWPARRALLRRLRARPSWLALIVVAAACGLAWLTRNLVLHGHPAWPLLAGPGGDPVPPTLAPFGVRFVDDPAGVLAAGGARYLELAWPVAPLLLASLLVAVRGRGPLRAVAACGVLGVVAWCVAPATGIAASPDLAAGATRYLMPAWLLLATAAWAALGERRPGSAALAAGGIAAVQLGLAVVYADGLPALDGVPIRHAALAGLVTLCVIALRRLPARARPLEAAARRDATRPGPAGRTPRRRIAPAVLAAAVAALLLAATPGFWERHAATLGDGRAPRADEVLLSTGGVPAFALGAYGRPGGRLVADCAALRDALAAGRTVAVGPVAPDCPLPGPSRTADGFRVHGGR